MQNSSQCDFSIDVYDESDEFFKNKSESTNSTQVKADTSSEKAYYCDTWTVIENETPQIVGEIEESEQMCYSRKRNVWPRQLINLQNNSVPILRENSARVEIEECL